MGLVDLSKQMGLTQEMLGLLTGIDQTTAGNWQNGKRVRPATAERFERCVKAASKARNADLQAMTVADYAYMGPVVKAREGEPLAQALTEMFTRGLSHVLVVDDHGATVGWLDEAAIARRLGVEDLRALRKAKVRGVMSKWGPPADYTIDGRATLHEAVARIGRHGALLVQDGERRGILTYSDLLKPVFLGVTTLGPSRGAPATSRRGGIRGRPAKDPGAQAKSL